MATVRMPSSWAARKTRVAISPLCARAGKSEGARQQRAERKGRRVGRKSKPYLFAQRSFLTLTFSWVSPTTSKLAGTPSPTALAGLRAPAQRPTRPIAGFGPSLLVLRTDKVLLVVVAAWWWESTLVFGIAGAAAARVRPAGLAGLGARVSISMGKLEKYCCARDGWASSWSGVFSQQPCLVPPGEAESVLRRNRRE